MSLQLYNHNLLYFVIYVLTVNQLKCKSIYFEKKKEKEK